MAGLIDLMISTNFDSENIAELLVHEEVNENLEANEDLLQITPILKATVLDILSTVKIPLVGGVGAGLLYRDRRKICSLDVEALM